MTQSSPRWIKALSWFMLVSLLYAFTENHAIASSIIPDATLGAERSQVIPNVGGLPREEIRGGARRGSNLFHSFRNFSINEGREAYFVNPAGVKNILGRVTGGNQSDISGTLGVSGNANLLLINPNGIIFGPNAQLDVAGSFVGTSADAIQFGDQGVFSATAPDSVASLTIQPSAFLFNQITAGQIENRSTASAGVNLSQEPLSGLRVPNGQSLLLVGGNIVVDGGRMNALGGRVELGGVAGPGTVGLTIEDSTLSLKFPEGVKRANVSLINGASVDVTAEGDGDISINANDLEISGTSQLLAGIEADLGSVNSQAGDITINTTGNINLTGATSTTQRSSVANLVQPGAAGQGGNIYIVAGSLSVTSGAELNTSTFGRANAGNIVINVRDDVQFEGGQVDGSSFASSRARSRLESSAEGEGGAIIIEAKTLSLADGGLLSVNSLGKGNAGNIKIDVHGKVEFNGMGLDNIPSGAYSQNNSGEGQGGSIEVAASSISVTEGAELNVNTVGQGDAGNIKINASDLVIFKGESSNCFKGESSNCNSSGAFSEARSESEGQGGKIEIKTGKLFVIAGAFLSASASGKGSSGQIVIDASRAKLDGIGLDGFPSGIYSQMSSNASGEGGNIKITTNTLSVLNGAQVSTISSQINAGKGGDIIINATDNVEVVGDVTVSNDDLESRLSTRTEGEGDAGDLSINTKDLIVKEGAQVSTGAFSNQSRGDGGNLMISASNLVQVIGGSPDEEVRSRITTRTEGTGDAKNLSLDTRNLIIREGAQVSAGTLGGSTGQGGNLVVTASELVEVTGESRDGGVFSRLTNRTAGEGDAGDFNLKTHKLIVREGGQISADTFKGGQGGNLSISASESVQVFGTAGNGFSSSLSSKTNGTGTAGGLEITTRQLAIRDGAELTVSGTKNGDAGNLAVNASMIQIDNQSAIKAETVSGNGGNIALKNLNLLLLRNNSQISTTAGTAQAGGDGGNIDIDTQLLVAIPRENSDITANAFEGKGGNIQITAQGIFGTQFRDQLTPSSDITASSSFGTDGTVQLDTSLDPTSGLVDLPVQPPQSQEVAQTCSPEGIQAQSEFVYTGRGGIPPTTQEVLNQNDIEVSWVGLDSKTDKENQSTAQPTPKTRQQKTSVQAAAAQKIVEAQGWISTDDGNVMLTASTASAPHQLSQQVCPSN